MTASKPEADEVFERAALALQLITRTDRKRTLRLKKHVRRILFSRFPGGHYLAGIQACRIGIEYARRVPAIELAMMIVHELTHARLAHAGFDYRGECRERIERLCVKHEILFAEQVTGSADAIRKSVGLLDSKWWDHSASQESTAEELRQRGVPRWLVRFILRWAAHKADH